MTVFDKARELSYAIIETDEFKLLEKSKIEYENCNISLEELLKAKKQYNNFIEQIFALVRANIYDEEEIESSNFQCSLCDKCNKCKS